MHAIEVENLTKIYGKGETAVTAIADATLQVQPGELVAILGPSGSGKTTLLTAIGLINEPTHGRVIIDGTMVADEGWLPGLDLKRLRREKLGFIFQQYNLLPRQSALRNVEMPLIYRGAKMGDRRRRAETALQIVGMGERMHHRPNELSGGQQQRVAIARALVGNPAVPGYPATISGELSWACRAWGPG